MALFQSPEKIIKRWNKKIAKRKKIVDMKLRSGRKTCNDNFSFKIEIPNKGIKANKSKRSDRTVRIVKKGKKNNTQHKKASHKKRRKSKYKISDLNQEHSFSVSNKSQQLFQNQSVLNSNTEKNQPSICATPNFIPLESLNQPATSRSNELLLSGLYQRKEQTSKSSNLSTTLTPNYSVITGSCEARNQHSPALFFPATSTPNQIENQPVTLTLNQVKKQLSKTSKSKSTNNINSIIQFHNEKSVNNSNSCKDNYYSPISDTSFTALDIRCDTIMSKNSSAQPASPLIVDNIKPRKKSKTAKCSVLRSIMNQDSDCNEQGETRQEKKLNVTAKNILSSSPKRRNKREKKDSVVNLASDDEIVILENESSDSKNKEISEIPVIDLCSPDQSSNQKTSKPKVKDNYGLLTLAPSMRRIRHGRVKSRRKNTRSRILLPNHLIAQASVPSTSRVTLESEKALRNYMSIMGSVGQRGPFPHATSTVTSATANDPPSSSVVGSNIYNPNPTQQTGLRPVVIDGSNVAFGHSNGAYFSCRGLQFCIEFFLKRNHKVLAFVPKFRKHDYLTRDPQILDELEKQGLVAFTPSRRIHGQLVVPYDDRYIVQYAQECGAIIVSTDNYRDLLRENPGWKETVEQRLLMFTWAGDILIFPQDPLGRYGPSLEEFLRFP